MPAADGQVNSYARSMQDDRPARPSPLPPGPASRSTRRAGVRADAEPEPTGVRARKGYRKGDETRERLISMAQEMIYEVGFNRASSREIARRAGVTFGVIQHHFGTFEALLLAAGEQGMAGMGEMLSGAEIPGKTTEEKLASIANLLWSYFSRPAYISYLEILTNLTHDPATSEETRARLRAGTVAMEKSWLQLMRRAFGRGHHGLVLRRLLFGTMQGLAVNQWMSEGQPSFAQERRLFITAIAAHLDSVDTTGETAARG
jgi:AcrR family transcriptional regulator